MKRGNILGPLLGVKDLLASSPTWQTIVGVVTATAAAAFIHLFEADDTADARPRAIVRWTEWQGTQVDNAQFNSHGTIQITIEVPPQRQPYWPAGYWPLGFWSAGYWPALAAPTSTQDVLTQFGLWVDEIVKEMQTNASGANPDDDAATFINASTFRLAGGPARSNSIFEQGDVFSYVKLHVEHDG